MKIFPYIIFLLLCFLTLLTCLTLGISEFFPVIASLGRNPSSFRLLYWSLLKTKKRRMKKWKTDWSLLKTMISGKLMISCFCWKAAPWSFQKRRILHSQRLWSHVPLLDVFILDLDGSEWLSIGRYIQPWILKSSLYLSAL